MGDSQFTVYGTVKLSTDEAAAGAKKVRSEIQNLGEAGIAGFEATRQKVIDLTKSLAELRARLLQATDPAAQKILNEEIGKTQVVLKAARTEMRGMSLESRETADKAQLLAAQFGVNLPGGLTRLIARSEAAQAALEAAFSASIVLAFGVAIVELGIKGWDALEKLRGKTEELQAWMKKAAAENMKLFLTFSSSAVGVQRIQELTKRQSELNAEIDNLKKKLEDVPPAAAALAIIIASKLSKAEEQERNLQTELNEAHREQIKVLKEEVTAKAKAAEASERHAEVLRKELLYWAEMKNAPVEAFQASLAAAEKSRAELDKYLEEQRHKFALESNREDQDVIREMEQRGGRFTKFFLDEVQQGRDAAKAAAEAQRAAVEKTANEIESFIDRVFLHARSLGDVFHQFLMQILGSFVKWVSLMVSQALHGLNIFGVQGTGSGGGLLGSLLNSLFHTGSSMTGGVTSAAAGTTATGIEGAWTGSLPQGAIGVWSGGSALTTAGGAAGALGGSPWLAPAGAAIGGTVAKLSPWGALAYGGYKLYNYIYQQGNPLLGSIVGPVGGPVDPFGILLGAWGRGKLKKKATALEQGFEATADELYDEFKKFKLDYDSAVTALRALITQGQQTLTSAGLGKWGQAGAQNLARSVQQEIAAVQSLQKQRVANAAVIAGMTVPEFTVGGPVGSGLLAIVHPGEFVMRREAVQALGAGFLSSLNRAPSFGEGGAVDGRGMQLAVGQRVYEQTFNLYQLPGESQHAFVKRVAWAVRRATGDGML